MLAHVSAATLSVDALIVHRAGQAEFQRVEELLRHDERSLRTYYAVVIAMLAGTVRPLAPFADSRPFFERFGFFNRAREIFVDAGAYVGDSVERFLWSVNGVFGHIHAFEPGALQFQALEKRVARLCEEWALSRDRISLVQKGLSADSRVALVDTAQDPTQMQLEEIDQRRESLTTTRVETISLDAYFKESPFTFLKVDIEGSEADLLRGAKQSIAQHRPRVALSVYHYPTDIFELPVQLQELNQDYCFHLGHHSSQLMETVLYAKDRDD
jgi:FkbM family methyltransferase